MTSQVVQQEAPSRFVPMTPEVRLLVLGYVIVYTVLIPGMVDILYGPIGELRVARLAATLLLQGVTFLPLVFYRRSYGWLHPLIFPALMTLAVSVLKNPRSLAAPIFLFSAVPPEILSHEALRGWSQLAIASALLKTSLLMSFGLICYYLGFFYGPRLPVPALRFPRPRHLALTLLSVSLFAGLVTAVFVQLRGGLIMQLLSFAFGRFRAMRGMGPVTVLASSGTLGVLLWLAFDDRALRRPTFWLAATVSIPLGFIVSGSRSAVIYPIATFIMMFMLRSGRVPRARIILFGFFALFIIGFLGAVRRVLSPAGGTGSAAAAEQRRQTVISGAMAEAQAREENGGNVAVAAKVPSEVDFLYGQTYVATAFFWMPRAIWKDKPRGGGAMAANLLFGISEEGGAVPIGGVFELYWNWFLPGVLVGMFLFGALHRWLVILVERYRDEPAVWAVFAVTLMYLAPDGTRIIQFIQVSVVLGALLLALGAVRTGPFGRFGAREAA